MGVDLPRRAGDPPLVSGPRPHEQVTQTAPPHLQERLVGLVSDLPGVEVGASYVCVAGTRAFHVSPLHARGPSEAFLAGTEFAHLHPSYDGSLHMALPPDLMASAIDAGWGQRHVHTGALLVFGARDEGEFTTVWTLLQSSYRYALGDDGPDPDPSRD